MAALRKIRRFVWGEIPETKTERKLLLKIDWFILSYCCLMVRLVTSCHNYTKTRLSYRCHACIRPSTSRTVRLCHFGPLKRW